MMLPVLYQDHHLVAVHKPSGLLVHRSPIDRHETRFALQMVRDQLGQTVYAAHRLDKGTSGVLVFGLTPEAGRALSQTFETQQARKTYLAIVRGHPLGEGRIDHALSRQHDDHDPGAGRVPTAPQPALTLYRRLAIAEMPWTVDGRYPTTRYALMALHPETGRRHQLRRHMKHIAHPIIGDATHGKGVHNRVFARETGVQRLLLAAVELALPHPVTGAPLVLTAPLAEDFMQAATRLGWQEAVPASWRPQLPAGSGTIAAFDPETPSC